MLETLSGSVVEYVLGTSHFIAADLVEVRGLGEELTGQAVGVFVRQPAGNKLPVGRALLPVAFTDGQECPSYVSSSRG